MSTASTARRRRPPTPRVRARSSPRPSLREGGARFRPFRSGARRRDLGPLLRWLGRPGSTLPPCGGAPSPRLGNSGMQKTS
eukprot:12475900-Alexandrium_andersonii.AAC.1